MGINWDFNHIGFVLRWTNRVSKKDYIKEATNSSMDSKCFVISLEINFVSNYSFINSNNPLNIELNYSSPYFLLSQNQLLDYPIQY